jgi:hypothetical protein
MRTLEWVLRAIGILSAAIFLCWMIYAIWQDIAPSVPNGV